MLDYTGRIKRGVQRTVALIESGLIDRENGGRCLKSFGAVKNNLKNKKTKENIEARAVVTNQRLCCLMCPVYNKQYDRRLRMLNYYSIYYLLPGKSIHNTCITKRSHENYHQPFIHKTAGT